MDKHDVAKKMPYLGDPLPHKGDTPSKSSKRFSRYMKSPAKEVFDIKGTHKSMRRQRNKQGLPF